MLGKLNIEPEQLSALFYYRTYFNMGTLGEIFFRMGLPRNSLESLMGRKDPTGKSSFKPGWKIIRYLPAMLVFLLSHLFLRIKFRRHFRKLRVATSELAVNLENAQPQDYPALFKRIGEVASAAAYFNIIVPLVMHISNRILQGKLKKRNIPYEDLSFSQDFPAIDQYDPGHHISKLKNRWLEMPEDVRNRLKTYADLASGPEEQAVVRFRQEFDRFLERFGHFSESGNDFSYTSWQEDPEFIFKMVTTGLPDENPDEDPAERDSPPRAGQEAGRKARLPGMAYRRAGRYRLYREMISSEFTRIYGFYRKLFLISGSYFVEKGWIKNREDVFYLTLEEHDRLLEGNMGDEVSLLQPKIEGIKEEMESCRDLSLPAVIYGEEPPILTKQDHTILNGIPTSTGSYKGRIAVVRGYEDFHKDVEGKILVIPFSDVGWTPLLLRAGAIVSESGGMLSHAAIVARELSIPSVSSVDHACQLEDGLLAKVDGTNGVLMILK
jgi:pyruvate,water dikinase